jgi:hypothetical protein
MRHNMNPQSLILPEMSGTNYSSLELLFLGLIDKWQEINQLSLLLPPCIMNLGCLHPAAAPKNKPISRLYSNLEIEISRGKPKDKMV